jgi:hypothetical protein
VHSTPLVNVFATVSEQQRAAFEQEICARWHDFVTDDGLELHVGMVTAIAETSSQR